MDEPGTPIRRMVGATLAFKSAPMVGTPHPSFALLFSASILPFHLAHRLLQQITLYANFRQKLRLCLGRKRQPPQLDEAQRGIMIELITAIVRCQAMVIE